MIDKKLLEILVCPLTQERLCVAPDGDELWCPNGGFAYPIRDGIPALIEAEARVLSAAEKEIAQSLQAAPSPGQDRKTPG